MRTVWRGGRCVTPLASSDGIHNCGEVSMRRPNQHVLVALAVVLTVACSSAPPPRRNTLIQQRLITTQEIGEINYSTAFEVVEALRPQWLRPRGRTSLNMREYVKVYLDDSLLGEPE